MCKCIGAIVGAVLLVAAGAVAMGVFFYVQYPDAGKTCDEGANSGYGICELQAADSGKAMGSLYFVQNSTGYETIIKGTVTGLTSGVHGIHIHEFGYTSNSCLDAGGHFNPTGEQHGGPDSPSHHTGDLGNIYSDTEDTNVFIVDDQVMMAGPWSVFGRAVVIQKDGDNLSLQKEEHNNPVACCVIYVSDGSM